ncbi:hypothetical protein JTB14_006237 [Gonioctena quinquepunctata]|nr:hypothetical protein JTB14_006237 [Gonioctena quinquepunctata]
MAAEVTLGIWNKSQFQKIKIENVDLQCEVERIKSEVQKIRNNSNFDLSYCGVILEDGNTLSSYGITSGATVHVLEKPISEKVQVEKKITTTELVKAFRTLTLFAGYRNTLQRLSRKEVMDKIIASTPSLINEPAVIALIQDPDLIVHLANSSQGPKIVQQYPILLEVANSIIFHVQEEQANVNLNQASTSTGYSYSLEALSDDDEDMDSSLDTGMSQNPLTRNSSFNAITAAQLAAAIANATNTQFNSNSVGLPSTPSGGNVITNEMFSNAIQQAFALGGGSNESSSMEASARPEDDMQTLSVVWQVQLQQMHEMGLLNDVVNIRALKVTNGDVNAAIEFILMK